ncbi:ABC transporter ATP-binding protein [Pikeienuella piscinae]|uniref:ABC transporter ATP-binding protein n=1 Tax=Pikeienuella piscinae TaxID=2748098 RepID=A0A7M3T787_9RHOB|nr:ABC transporter ATP-binding protein [Pikeienuella piscinae]QIE57868.1 ABC transporter ATP-binding protein [Pikeienuella piscinae]
MEAAVLFQARGLNKSFPGVKANDDIAFTVREGEIHALLGENGAGKSTLVKMIYGVQRPDEGEMRMRGAPYAPDNPGDARAAGVGMVFQHFSLFEAMSVAENVALGMNDAPPARKLNARIREVSAAYGLPLDPTRLVGELSVGERQRIEIVRSLLQNPRLLIMDEPTSVLTPQEVERLFATLRKLAAEGVAILYISHKLDEIRALCHGATILRSGKVTGECDPRAETTRSLAEMMIGRSLATPRPVDWKPGKARLSVDKLSVKSAEPFGVDLTKLSFVLRAGDILGVGGVAGNGQDELLGALSGETRTNPATIRLADAPIGHLGPSERRLAGLCVAPEERLGHAAAPDMSLTENAVLTARSRARLVGGSGLVRQGAAARFARNVVETYDVRTAGVEHAAKSLSGGNLQKFVVGREIAQRPDVFVVSQPTWGVDAGAAEVIHDAIRTLAKGGAAVMVISQDLDELMEVSTLLSVIAEGRLSFPVPVADITVEQIGVMMGGGGIVRADQTESPVAGHA